VRPGDRPGRLRQQAAATRQLLERITCLAAERQQLIEDLAAARQRAGEEAAAAATARAEVDRLAVRVTTLQALASVAGDLWNLAHNTLGWIQAWEDEHGWDSERAAFKAQAEQEIERYDEAKAAYDRIRGGERQ
jgi:hypothetical protein